jgi:hypothetical protein
LYEFMYVHITFCISIFLYSVAIEHGWPRSVYALFIYLLYLLLIYPCEVYMPCTHSVSIYLCTFFCMNCHAHFFPSRLCGCIVEGYLGIICGGLCSERVRLGWTRRVQGHTQVLTERGSLQCVCVRPGRTRRTRSHLQLLTDSKIHYLCSAFWCNCKK